MRFSTALQETAKINTFKVKGFRYCSNSANLGLMGTELHVWQTTFNEVLYIPKSSSKVHVFCQNSSRNAILESAPLEIFSMLFLLVDFFMKVFS